MTNTIVVTKLDWFGPSSNSAEFMCPHCFDRKNIPGMSVKATIPVRPDVEVYTTQIQSLIDHLISVTCDKCGEEMVHIDSNIVGQIVRLNSAGYHTVYCCGGHKLHDRLAYSAMPYIMFGVDIDDRLVDAYPDRYREVVDYVNHMKDNINILLKESLEYCKSVKPEYYMYEYSAGKLMDALIVESYGKIKFSVQFTDKINDILLDPDSGVRYDCKMDPFSVVLGELFSWGLSTKSIKDEWNKVLQILEDIEKEG